MLIDIHRHSSSKGNADQVLRNLFHSEVDQIESTNICSIGLHPWHLNPDTWREDIMVIKDYAGSDKVLAIGETGLDKAIETPLEDQRNAFNIQLQIASDFNKPVIIHCVRAYDELLSFRKNSNNKLPWIIHWYNGSPQTGEDLIKKNCYLSFGHMLLNEKSKAYKTFLKVPLEKVFFETDDANINIDEVYKRAATLRNIKEEKIVEIIKHNFEMCFKTKL